MAINLSGSHDRLPAQLPKGHERDALHRSLCPQVYGTDDEDKRKDTLKSIAKLSQSISIHAYNIGRLERGAFGFTCILGTKPEEIETVSLSLMVTARLDPSANREVWSVGDVIGYTASRNLETAARVRALFRTDGSLFGLVNLSGVGVGLDERRVRLKEAILNVILAMPRDNLNEILSEMEPRR